MTHLTCGDSLVVINWHWLHEPWSGAGAPIVGVALRVHTERDSTACWVALIRSASVWRYESSIEADLCSGRWRIGSEIVFDAPFTTAWLIEKSTLRSITVDSSGDSFDAIVRSLSPLYADPGARQSDAVIGLLHCDRLDDRLDDEHAANSDVCAAPHVFVLRLCEHALSICLLRPIVESNKAQYTLLAQRQSPVLVNNRQIEGVNTPLCA